jgi:hypothetical protein
VISQEREKIAKKYVDKQLETMKRHGLIAKKISAGEYRLLVRKVAETVKA